MTILMANLLAKAKSWFIESTFKIVSKPFSQMFSIYAFICSGNSSKQVLLAYVLMSGKQKEDYVHVMEKIIQLLPSPPRVTSITIDFEAAMWLAFYHVLPNVKVLGCHISYVRDTRIVNPLWPASS